MESMVRWASGLRFEGLFSTGHTITLDASQEAGGTDAGARPIELLLMGLAGCTGIDVISILRKKRQDVTAFQVRVAGERPDGKIPKVFTNIHIVYEVTGIGIDRRAVEQAVTLSEEKYCSASAMLRAAVPISSEIQISEEKT